MARLAGSSCLPGHLQSWSTFIESSLFFLKGPIQTASHKLLINSATLNSRSNFVWCIVEVDTDQGAYKRVARQFEDSRWNERRRAGRIEEMH